MKYAIVVLFLASVAFPKNRAYQDGEAIKYIPYNRGAAVVPINGMLIAAPLGYVEYEFESSNLQIMAVTRKPLNVTLGKMGKLAIENQNLFFIDDSGKEKKLRIVAKRIKPVQPAREKKESEK